MSELFVEHLASRGIPLGGRWLDVGTGGGGMADALSASGAEVVALDVSDRRLPGAGRVRFVLGRGERLAFATGSFDGVVSSNVLEHAPDRWRLFAELLRVVRPGGHVALSWTNWYSPFGGHEWSPFHYLGPRLGPRAYRAVRGREPPHTPPGRNLYVVHVGETLRALRRSGAEILDVGPRYWPTLRFLARIPLVREIALWNCVVLMRRPLAAGRAPGADPGSPTRRAASG
ncbi:MAG: class I SAM-dependent methyltransferase [Actinobacteria bacterium]|nr:class I SAM-dependent methyltransferase [Actinomycetota bacterium]